MSEEKRRCENCIYFCRDSQKNIMGECRRRPPVVGGDATIGTRYPGVYSDDWCGEHLFGDALEIYGEGDIGE